MGYRYHALCAYYPWEGYYIAAIESQHLIPFLFKLAKASLKFDIVDVQIRK